MSVTTDITGKIYLNNKFTDSDFHKIYEVYQLDNDIDINQIIFGKIQSIIDSRIPFNNATRAENIFHRLDDACALKDNVLTLDIEINHYDEELRIWLILLGDSIDDIDIVIDNECCYEHDLRLTKDALKEFIFTGDEMLLEIVNEEIDTNLGYYPKVMAKQEDVKREVR